MRIVHVLSNLHEGGAQRVVTELSSAMSKRFAVEVWTKCRRPVVYSLPDRVEFTEMSESGCLKSWNFVIALVRLIRCRRPNVIVAHTNRNTAPAIVAGILTKTPVYVVEHTVSDALVSVPFRVFRFFAYPFARRVIVLSTDQRFKYRCSRTVVMPNPLPERMTKESQAWSRPPSDSRVLRVLYVGRLEFVKGVDRLLEICSLLSIPFRLDIVGDGSQRKPLERQAHLLGVRDQVTFHGWKNDVTPYYRSNDVIALTSRMEGFGMVLVEAMAFGCVPVAFDVPGGIRDIYVHERSGYLIPDGAFAVFADTLEKTLIDRNRLQPLREAARKRAMEHTLEITLETWLQLFREDGLM